MCGFYPLSYQGYTHVDKINLVFYTGVLFRVIMFYFPLHHTRRNFAFAARVFTSEGSYSALTHNVRVLVNYFLLISSMHRNRPLV